MADQVTLARWLNATEKPPVRGSLRLTSAGVLFYTTTWLHDAEAPKGGYYADMWCRQTAEGFKPSVPQPTVYCDPVPPGPDALTVEDLRVLVDPRLGDFVRRIEAREALTRALDALRNGGKE